MLGCMIKGSFGHQSGMLMGKGNFISSGGFCPVKSLIRMDCGRSAIW